MKKYICAFLSAAIIFSLIIMSGCSDFEFNPLGTWEYSEEIYYIDGKEVNRVEKNDMLYGGMKYIFEKSGTGYIDVANYRSQEFTYDYDDKNVFVHLIIPDDMDASKIPNNNGIVETEYTVYDSDGDSPAKLIRTEEYKAKDENGKEVSVKTEYVLVKL